MIAQSIIPGIFHGDRASKHVYGSMNHGEVIESKPEFHALMATAAEKLQIKPHKVVDGKGQEVELATCVESKGIVGSDGRNYVLDLLRVFPRDANFTTKPSVAAAAAEEAKQGEEKTSATDAQAGASSIHSFLLRPELVKFYCRTRAFEQLFPSTPEAKEQKEADDAARESARKEKLAAREVERKEAAKAAGEEYVPESEEQLAEVAAEMERAEMDALYTAALQSHSFNPDSLTDVKLGGTPEEREKDEAELRKLASYLKTDLLQKLLTGLRNLEMSPVDTQHLTHLLHENGINMRYLSSIITLAQSLHLPHIEAMCIQECVVRSCKHIFNSFLRGVTPEKGTSVLANEKHANATVNLGFAQLIAKFLNSLFGVNALGHKISEEQMAAADTVVKALREEEAEQRREYNASLAAAAAAQAAAIAPPEELTPEAEVEAAAKAEATAAAAAAAAAKKKEATPVRDMVIRLGDGSRAPTDPLSPANLWQLIRLTVKEKFDYDLPAYLPVTARSKVCMLRSFCLKTGVQLLCRDYDLAPNSKVSPSRTRHTHAWLP